MKCLKQFSSWIIDYGKYEAIFVQQLDSMDQAVDFAWLTKEPRDFKLCLQPLSLREKQKKLVLFESTLLRDQVFDSIEKVITIDGIEK